MNPMLPAEVQTGLVLASASPRRAQILEMLGFEFERCPTRVEEEHSGHSEPLKRARGFARLKAEAAARGRERGTLIGADTIVVAEGRVLEQPGSRSEALEMLRVLSNRWHTVHTGVALLDVARARRVDAVEATEVRFNAFDDADLERYVDTGEPYDKAGAYAIQGHGALLVREIRGCFYNVMGFPVSRFVALLRQLHSTEVHGAG